MKSLQDLNEMMKKRHCIDKTYLTICKGYMDSCEMVDYVKKDADNKMIFFSVACCSGVALIMIVVHIMKL